ncbi:hypothetical protein MIMGU_mgv11b019824mg [Erythranthe guttata]|uniref:Uncharacterized protein n=1 Tax=Erythranthe guttata TaxID=4155 RepID=A0A022RF25_ERYGU|nr:hypothetical protein MIMGU_mgv11b019824mg [Erythranthe guttata]
MKAEKLRNSLKKHNLKWTKNNRTCKSTGNQSSKFYIVLPIKKNN